MLTSPRQVHILSSADEGPTEGRGQAQGSSQQTQQTQLASLAMPPRCLPQLVYQ
ncbi:Protein of unknown function [Pyronema omphalodes CBS 100304]|uniref:Uncharacterized protein n=1 Tax=Pyronema omphalodes (strain CBS 100304) TaxID=1076935 RepID=U4L1L1_PYROM|nr:Protein of unknown function [Pyronema omphalodes CBS 100304]